MTVTLPLPAGVLFVSAGPDVTSSGGQVVAELGTMVANAQITFNVILQPTVVGNLEQTASVSSDSYDPVASNNTSSVTTQVIPAADLAVSLTGSASTANTIDDFTYTVVVTNNGPDQATDVEVNDTLPAGATVVSLSSTSGVPTQTDGVVSLSIGSLDQGATATMTIVVAPERRAGLDAR